MTEPLAHFTARVPKDMLAELRRVAFTNRAEGKKPDTVQEIVRRALETWLKRNG